MSWYDKFRDQGKSLVVGIIEVVQKESSALRASLTVTRPQVVNPAIVRVGGFVFTRDVKEWSMVPTYGTREQAIMAALTAMEIPVGDSLYTGRVVLEDATVAAPSFSDYLQWFADAVEQSHGKDIAIKLREELMRIDSGLYKEATNTLRQLLTNFLAKTTFALYKVADVQQHIIPEAPDTKPTT